MIFAFISENQVVIRKISVKYIDPKFVQELNNILKVSHLPAVFPVEVFAGHRMPDREIGVIGVPSDIESAFWYRRTLVLSAFRYRSRFCQNIHPWKKKKATWSVEYLSWIGSE